VLYTAQIIVAVFPLYICCWFSDIRFHSFGVEWGSPVSIVIAEEVDRVGDKESGNNKSDDVETPLMAFLVDFHTCGLFLSCRSIRILEDQHSE